MDLQTTIFKRKTGRHKGKWVLEVTYWDEVKGKQCAAVRMFSKKLNATDARPQLEKDLRSTHGQIQTGRKMTFADLCAIAKADFYREAVIEQGRKSSGNRRRINLGIVGVSKQQVSPRFVGIQNG